MPFAMTRKARCLLNVSKLKLFDAPKFGRNIAVYSTHYLHRNISVFTNLAKCCLNQLIRPRVSMVCLVQFPTIPSVAFAFNGYQYNSDQLCVLHCKVFFWRFNITSFPSVGVRSTYEESMSIKNVSFLQLLTCVVVCTSRQYDRRKFVIFRLAKLCLFLRYHLPAHYDIRFIMLRASVRLANITIYLFHKRAKYLHLFFFFFLSGWTKIYIYTFRPLRYRQQTSFFENRALLLSPEIIVTGLKWQYHLFLASL